MSDQDVDAFLEHFGVKGMKWGVRRDAKTGIRPVAQTLSRSKLGDLSRANVNRHNRKVTKYGRSGSKLTAEQRANRRQRSARRSNTAVKITFGTLFAIRLLAALNSATASKTSSGPRPFPGDASKFKTKSVSDLINDQRDVKINALKKTHAEGHITKEQLDNFTSVMNKRYDKKIREAMG